MLSMETSTGLEERFFQGTLNTRESTLPKTSLSGSESFLRISGLMSTVRTLISPFHTAMERFVLSIPHKYSPKYLRRNFSRKPSNIFILTLFSDYLHSTGVWGLGFGVWGLGFG